MGVPAFYKWLVDKYPRVVDNVVEDKWLDELGNAQAVDATQPNPNGIEYDNLYLDMNGIIHPCFHPEDRPNPTSEDEVFRNVFEYIDRLFSMIRPRRLVYMAIDGVAPRAKMNQQRSRRFRAAQEAQERQREEEALRKQLEREGIKVPPPEDKETKFDSNVITPGTPFMWRLSIALQYYVHLRLNNSPAWRNIDVILSDSNCPGEGEHKIMKFIRLQRGLDGYDPNLRHVVYGLDADLIMLCLATHEANCTILREQVQANKQEQETEEEKMQRMIREADQQHKSADQSGKEEERKPPISTKPFQLLSVPKLRQYLQYDLQLNDPTIPQDNEAILDDFVFMCFFVGNDFLPHSPTLEIREKAIDLLMQVYKNNLRYIGGHLCDGPNVHLERVERFARLVGQYEEQIFMKRIRIADKQKSRRQREKAKRKRIDHADPGVSQFQAEKAELCRDYQNGRCRRGNDCRFRHPDENDGSRNEFQQQQQQQQHHHDDTVPSRNQGASAENQNQSAAAAIRSKLSGAKRENDQPLEEIDSLPSKAQRTNGADSVSKRAVRPDENDEEHKASSDLKAEDTGNEKQQKQQQFWALLAKKSTKEKPTKANEENTKDTDTENQNHDESKTREKQELDAHEFAQKLEAIIKEKNDIDEDDSIRLGESGWRERYYQDKVGATPETMQSVVNDMVCEYVRGLCWVMRYYYEGCASWGWYYPYHYAPFISDLVDISDIDTSFELGKPFKPLDQLMSVLPSASAHCLPEPYAELMQSPDSPLKDFYPIDFKLDMNGKRWAWQAVCLLPFIDEDRLLKETKAREAQLTADERRRNMQSLATMYVHPSHPLAEVVKDMDERYSHLSAKDRIETEEALDPQKAGFNGYMVLPAGSSCPPRLESPVKDCDDIRKNHVWSFCYKEPQFRQVEPKLLPGAEPPIDPNITSMSIKRPKLWHEDVAKGPQGTQEVQQQMNLATNPLAFAPQQQQQTQLQGFSTPLSAQQYQAMPMAQTGFAVQQPQQASAPLMQQMMMMNPQQIQQMMNMVQPQGGMMMHPTMPQQPLQQSQQQPNINVYGGQQPMMYPATNAPVPPPQQPPQQQQQPPQAAQQQQQGHPAGGGRFSALGNLPNRPRDPRQR